MTTKDGPQFATALVTGASKGLGAALLSALARRGTAVAGFARDGQAMAETVARARRGTSARVVGFPADIGEPAAATRVAMEAAAAIGDVDLLVHNASDLGPVPLRPLADIDEAALRRVFATNVVGPLALTRAVVGGMVVRGRGTIVFVSSDAATEPYPTWGAYGASKAAADHAARILARELEGTGVRVLSVDPGEMDTDMHGAAAPESDRRLLRRPADVAERVLAILADPVAHPSGARVRVELVGLVGLVGEGA